MGPRALIATALTFVLTVGLLLPAGAAERLPDVDGTPNDATTVAGVAASAAAGHGALTPLDRPQRVVLPGGPRTGADIVGGAGVRRGTHGFVALILLLDGDGEITSSCTGTLIRRRYVLTAAHCLLDTQGAAVALRVTRLQDVRPRHITFADGYAIAPSYKPHLGRNDVGILRLEKATDVKPITLAGVRDDGRLKPGIRAKVLGWGVIDATTSTDRLRRGRVTLWSTSACRAMFGSLWLGTRMLCAGSPTTDVCFGDSGGPLLVRGPSRWIQHGITSFGDDQCAVGDASVYARVSATRDWVERVTGLRHRS